MTDIHDAIAAWHDSPEDGVPLYEHLGLTWPEYVRWAEVGELPDGSPYTDSDKIKVTENPELAPVPVSNLERS